MKTDSEIQAYRKGIFDASQMLVDGTPIGQQRSLLLTQSESVNEYESFDDREARILSANQVLIKSYGI